MAKGKTYPKKTNGLLCTIFAKGQRLKAKSYSETKVNHKSETAATLMSTSVIIPTQLE